ncbi:MAG: HIT family protein [Acidobacteria bacterium]|nr:HIT family protein [Acidobacteriota bacterium]
MPTLFEKIARGEIPCHKVWEDEEHLAFLDVNPRVEGHTLVIPKKAYEDLYTMPDAAYRRLLDAVRTVALRLQSKTGCAKVVLLVIGFDVPHVHVHLMPTNSLAEVALPPVNRDAQSRLAETAAWLAR